MSNYDIKKITSPNFSDTSDGIINKSGQIAGTYVDSSQTKNGFIYNAGTFTTIITGTDGKIIGFDNAGQTVVQYTDIQGNTHGVIADSNNIAPIDDPYSKTGDTRVDYVSPSGQVIVSDENLNNLLSTTTETSRH